MARALWKGVISFGLVNIPVELHPAVRDHRPRFRLLHAADKSPIHYERVCEREGKAVAWQDLVKGYEYEKGKFVVLTKDDFRAAALAKSKSIDVLDFVDPRQIDDRYFDTSYYLVPGTGGARGYALLRAAIQATELIGIGKIVLREDQHLAALIVVEDALVLTMLRYPDELLDVGQFKFPSAKEARGKEIELAKTLVKSLEAPWDASRYTDDYQTNLMRVIRAKLSGKGRAAATVTEPKQTAVVDLMERLKQSLESGKKRRATSRPRRRSRRAA